MCRLGNALQNGCLKLADRNWKLGIYLAMSEMAEYNTFLNFFFSANSRNTHFFEKYVRIKIGDHKILVLMRILLLKLDEVNVTYACNYNSIL